MSNITIPSGVIATTTVIPNFFAGVCNDINSIEYKNNLSKANVKLDRLLFTVDFALDKSFLKTAITKDNTGKFFLVISPINEDKSFKNLSADFFNKKLGLKEDVIKNDKDNKLNDDGTIKDGSKLYIPLEEIGQKSYSINGGNNKDLKKAIRKFNKLSSYINF